MTFICANLDQKTQKALKEYAIGIGINESKFNSDLHATIVYSEEELGLTHGTNPLSGTMKPVGLKYLGALGSKWRAIVVEVQSDVLQERYNYYLSKGYKPRFPNYLQHISLAYEPDELDLSTIKLPDFDLIVCSETIKKSVIN